MTTAVYFRDPTTRKLGHFDVDTLDHEVALSEVRRALRRTRPFPRPILALIDCAKRRIPPPVPPGELEYASWARP